YKQFSPKGSLGFGKDFKDQNARVIRFRVFSIDRNQHIMNPADIESRASVFLALSGVKYALVNMMVTDNKYLVRNIAVLIIFRVQDNKRPAKHKQSMNFTHFRPLLRCSGLPCFLHNRDRRPLHEREAYLGKREITNGRRDSDMKHERGPSRLTTFTSLQFENREIRKLCLSVGSG
ncbi:unnamed protein product, partial [Acanthocheilonema viteae]